MKQGLVLSLLYLTVMAVVLFPVGEASSYEKYDLEWLRSTASCTNAGGLDLRRYNNDTHKVHLDKDDVCVFEEAL